MYPNEYLKPNNVYIVSDRLPEYLYQRFSVYSNLEDAMIDASAGVQVLCYGEEITYTSKTGVTVIFTENLPYNIDAQDFELRDTVIIGGTSSARTFTAINKPIYFIARVFQETTTRPSIQQVYLNQFGNLAATNTVYDGVGSYGINFTATLGVNLDGYTIIGSRQFVSPHIDSIPVTYPLDSWVIPTQEIVSGTGTIYFYTLDATGNLADSRLNYVNGIVVTIKAIRT